MDKKFTETAEQHSKRVLEHHERLDASKGICEVIIAKNRHGPSGVATLKFIGETTKFEELGNDGSY